MKRGSPVASGIYIFYVLRAGKKAVGKLATYLYDNPLVI
jgi:hypothetical protein